jgi:hypothetical protein
LLQFVVPAHLLARAYVLNHYQKLSERKLVKFFKGRVTRSTAKILFISRRPCRSSKRSVIGFFLFPISASLKVLETLAILDY